MRQPAIPVSVAAAEAGLSMVEGNPVHQRMDEVSFQDFYTATAPKLWSYVRRASGDAALADDILQEAFLRFLRADLPALEEAQRKAYLYRIAGSLLADHWRRIKRERRWSFDSLLGRKTSESTGQGSDTLRLFERLKPQQQTLLWLAYVEGFDHREVAAALHLREKSVRVLLFRARKKLAALLANERTGGEERL